MRPDPVSFGWGWPLVLSFERPYDAAWQLAVVRRVFELLDGCWCRVTDSRPNDWPSKYGVCVVGADISVMGRAGYAPVGDFALPDNGAVCRANCVYGTAFLDPAMTAAVAAHELLHGLGLPHDNVPGSLMNGDVLGPASRVLPAARQLVADRVWAYYDGGHYKHVVLGDALVTSNRGETWTSWGPCPAAGEES